MSEESRNFKRNLFIPEKKEGVGIAPAKPRKGQVYQLKEFVYQKQSGKKPFSFDSKKARNFDPENVNRAREGVKELLKDAVNKAKEQSLVIRKDANNEGYAVGRKEGFQAGENNAREVFAPFLESLQEIIQELSGLRKRMYVKMEREMVEMIVELTKKIIRFEMSEREDSVKDIIRLAVKSVLDRETMVIKVHPEDKTYAESYRPELHKVFRDAKNISFVAHPGVPRGGCMVDSNFGRVEANLDNLNEQIEKILQLAPSPEEEPAHPKVDITAPSPVDDRDDEEDKEDKEDKEIKIEPEAKFWWKQ